METCLRGFSYMPEMKVDVVDLKYIEGEELERTWRTARRQRLKDQEQKIWDEFVKEQDILGSVCQEDPYQFLQQLPEACLKELMEVELEKMKKQTEMEKEEQDDDQQQGDGDSPQKAEEPTVPTVTFDDDLEEYDSDVIHIFDDTKDDDLSGPEDEAIIDSPGSPPTVRDKFEEDKEIAPVSPPASPGKGSNKSSENVTSMIENSIYCAKVRDLRMKINDEIMAIISSLERREILSAEPEELVKMGRRSAEFCARFNRNYVYPLHRQIHDIKRHNVAALPFARHTQFQSAMLRIVSLHQNLLQAFQMFHKSFSQTCCVRESADMARCLSQVSRAASQAARDAPQPKFRDLGDLYDDAVLPACDKLEEAIDEYASWVTSYLESAADTSTTRSKKSSNSRMKKSVGTWSKSGSKIKSVDDSRLSMYSLDTRIHLKPKSSSSKENQSSGTSKLRGAAGGSRAEAKEQTPRKTPRSRRPLMRDAQPARARTRPPRRDAEIRTMVEAVEACTSSHMSREPTPPPSPRAGARGGAGGGGGAGGRRESPRRNTPRKSLNSSPRLNNLTGLRTISPRKLRRSSPKPAQALKAALGSVKSSCDPLDTAESSQMQMNSVSRIQCATKEKSPARSDVDDTSPMSPSKTVDSPRSSPRPVEAVDKADKVKTKLNNNPGGRCEVSRIVRQLCGGDTAGRNRNERVSGAKNAQLLCVNSSSSPRQPSTPQLLRILEETIQKKVPKPMFQKNLTPRNTERFRLTFNIPERTTENLFLYRTKFVQHMLASPMYANSVVGKPWETIGSISEQIIDDLLVQCAEEMQLNEVVQELYRTETR